MNVDLAVAWTTDDNNIEPLVASVHSVVKHWSRGAPLHVFILAWNVTSNHKRCFTDWVSARHPGTSVTWIDGSHEALPPGRGHLPAAAYLRLFLPYYISAKRIIYLDTDTIAVADLSSLRNLDLSGFALGAVLDGGVKSALEVLDAEICDVFNITSQDGYFNSGVLVFDAEQWRNSTFREDCFKVAQTYGGRLTYCDQDSLNCVFKRAWLPMDNIWNCQVGRLNETGRKSPTRLFKQLLTLGEYRIIRDAKVLHYSGPLKPWTGGPRTVGFGTYVGTLHDARWLTSWDITSRILKALASSFDRLKSSLVHHKR